jgi:hypothetical protein
MAEKRADARRPRLRRSLQDMNTGSETEIARRKKRNGGDVRNVRVDD